eukprot:3179810-Amphidinium_carterae.1
MLRSGERVVTRCLVKQGDLLRCCVEASACMEKDIWLDAKSMSDPLDEEPIFETAQEQQDDATEDTKLKVEDENGPAIEPPCPGPKQEEGDEPMKELPDGTTAPTVLEAAVVAMVSSDVTQCAEQANGRADEPQVASSDVTHCAEQTNELADEPQVLDQERDLIAKLTQHLEPFLTEVTAAEAQAIVGLMAKKLVRVQNGITWLYKHLQELGVSSPTPLTVAHLCATGLIKKSKQRDTIAAILQHAIGNKEWSDAQNVLKTHAMVSLIQDELWKAWEDMRGATTKNISTPAWRCVLTVTEVPVTSERSESSPNNAVARESHDQWKPQSQSQSSGDSWSQWRPKASWSQNEWGKRRWSESSHWSDWDWKKNNDDWQHAWAEKQHRWHNQCEQQKWHDEEEDDNAPSDTGVATSCVEEFTVLDAIHRRVKRAKVEDPTPPPWRVKVKDWLPPTPPVAIKPRAPPWASKDKFVVAEPPPPTIAPPVAQPATLPIPPDAVRAGTGFRKVPLPPKTRSESSPRACWCHLACTKVCGTTCTCCMDVVLTCNSLAQEGESDRRNVSRGTPTACLLWRQEHEMNMQLDGGSIMMALGKTFLLVTLCVLCVSLFDVVGKWRDTDMFRHDGSSGLQGLTPSLVRGANYNLCSDVVLTCDSLAQKCENCVFHGTPTACLGRRQEHEMNVPLDGGGVIMALGTTFLLLALCVLCVSLFDVVGKWRDTDMFRQDGSSAPLGLTPSLVGGANCDLCIGVFLTCDSLAQECEKSRRSVLHGTSTTCLWRSQKHDANEPLDGGGGDARGSKGGTNPRIGRTPLPAEGKGEGQRKGSNGTASANSAFRVHGPRQREIVVHNSLNMDEQEEMVGAVVAFDDEGRQKPHTKLLDMISVNVDSLK